MIEDFSQIVLSKKELKFLNKISKQKIADTDVKENELTHLLDEKFIEVELYDKYRAQAEDLSPKDFYWKISKRGENYLRYRTDIIKERVVSRREFRITTIIAVIALIKSFMPQIRQAMELILILFKPQ